jgi:hypothetical protein
MAQLYIRALNSLSVASYNSLSTRGGSAKFQTRQCKYVHELIMYFYIPPPGPRNHFADFDENLYIMRQLYSRFVVYCTPIISMCQDIQDSL